MDHETLPPPPDRPHDPALPRPVVWITRTRDGAERTAKAISDAGGVPLIAPVMEAVPARAHIAPDSFDALVVTSGNAVTAFAEMCERRDMTVYCVGDRTCKIALDNGFKNTRSARGDVSALFDLICADASGSTRLLYAAPHDPAAPLADWLRDQGYAVTQVTAYETKLIEPALSEADYRRITHVLIHSPRAGAATARVLIRQAQKVTFETLTLVCISEAAWHAAHEEIEKAGGENSVARRLIRRISAFPDEASMLRLLG
jgi:uroporphyrinogen-III synthase